MMVREEPRVGVWWLWKGSIFDFSSPLSEAEEVEGFANGAVCHVDAWPNLQKIVPEFANLDYSDISRGRVVAINRTDLVLYASKIFLCDDKKIEAVLSRFCLDRAATILMPDDHYEKTIRRKELPPPRMDEDELEEL